MTGVAIAEAAATMPARTRVENCILLEIKRVGLKAIVAVDILVDAGCSLLSEEQLVRAVNEALYTLERW